MLELIAAHSHNSLLTADAAGPDFFTYMSDRKQL